MMEKTANNNAEPVGLAARPVPWERYHWLGWPAAERHHWVLAPAGLTWDEAAAWAGLWAGEDGAAAQIVALSDGETLARRRPATRTPPGGCGESAVTNRR